MSEEITSTETTSAETPATTEATPQVQGAAGADPQAEATSAETGTPQVPAYAANFKFKAYDKEHEIDEMFRPLIKDADTEKKVKAIFEKAYALDDMKPKYQKSRSEYEAYRKDADPILSSVNTLQQMLNRGDIDNFMRALKIPDDMLYKHVLNKLQLKDMTPAQRQDYEMNVNARQQSILAEQQTQQFREMFETQAVQNRTVELDMVLDKPDVKAIASAFENAHGPGSFRNAVIDHGFNVWKARGVDLTASQAIQEFTKVFAPFMQGGMGQQAQNTVQPQQAGRPPVIPNIAGRSTSPVRQVPKSIADLKKLASQMSDVS